jgi:hypothetical protein
MDKKIKYIHPQIQEKIKSDISYLGEFDNCSAVEDENSCCWRYYYQTPHKSYKVLCVVKRDKENHWSLKINVYWLKFSKNVTQGEGKDAEYTILPCKGYKNFVNQANMKLKNNLILGVKMYDDDYSFEMDRQIIRMIIELIKKFPEMDALNFKYYDDLKKIYHDVIHKSDKEVLDYIQKKYPNVTDKQFILIRFDTLNSVDNFHRMNKMKLNPHI